MVSGITKTSNWDNVTAANMPNEAPVISGTAAEVKTSGSTDIVEKSPIGMAHRESKKSQLALPDVKEKSHKNEALLNSSAKPAEYDVLVGQNKKATGSIIKKLSDMVGGAVEWNVLPPQRQNVLENDENFSKLSLSARQAVVKMALGLNDESFLQTVKMFENVSKLPANSQKLVFKTIGEGNVKKQMVRLFNNMLNDKNFNALDNDTKTAILSQCAHTPLTGVVHKLSRLPSTDWFNKMELPDRQRAAKSIAYLTEVSLTKVGSAQNILLENTINRLLSGEMPLNFVDMNDDPNYITYGYAIEGKKGIYINRFYIPGDNEAFPKESPIARHALLATVPHEVNHQVNGDKNRATYAYFQAEYRAWYVGYIAEHGHAPTRQEAYDRCIDLFGCYPNIDKARKSTKFFGMWTGDEAQKIIGFMQQFNPYIDFKHSDPRTADYIMNMSVSSPDKAAPMPDAKLKPDMDN